MTLFTFSGAIVRDSANSVKISNSVTALASPRYSAKITCYFFRGVFNQNHEHINTYYCPQEKLMMPRAINKHIIECNIARQSTIQNHKKSHILIQIVSHWR